MSHRLQAFLIELPADASYAAAKALARRSPPPREWTSAIPAPRGPSMPARSRCGSRWRAPRCRRWGAATVVQQIVEMCRRKGAPGARLVLADGTSIPIERLSAQALLELAGKADKPV